MGKWDTHKKQVIVVLKVSIAVEAVWVGFGVELGFVKWLEFVSAKEFEMA